VTRSSATAAQLRPSDIIRPYWGALTVALLGVFGETMADVLEPWPIKVVVDHILQSKRLPSWLGGTLSGLFSQDRFAIVDCAVAAVLVIAVVGAVSAYGERYLTASVSQRVAHDLRRMLYNHIQRLSLAEHRQSRSGDLVARVTGDIDAIQDFINSALLGVLVNLLTLCGMAGVMLWINWRFTLVALSIAPVLSFVIYFYTRRIKNVSRAVRKKESELLSGVAESLTFIHVVHAFGREDYEERRFESESRQNMEAALQARGVKARLSPIVDVIAAVGTCMVLGYGARLAIAGDLSAGTMILFLMYLGKTYKPMRDLSKMTNTISKAAVSYERIREVLDIESRVRDLPNARSAPPLNGQIEFDHVTFGYGDEAPVLNDVSLRIEPGQVAAIVGPSGTGKTTIISLISRFYDPSSGQVRIDGMDIRDYTLKSLRDQISFVLQDTLLFRATIWENIAYGRLEAPPEDTIRAAKLANAHEFIVKMPLGYGTMVGERGVTLSGGQRQRIAIARAIVRNTPILILDEPTAGLDAASERLVMEALDRLMEGRTSVVIAHHLSTIRYADVIFVIKDSGLVEQGSHDALLAKGGLYAEWCRSQMTADAGITSATSDYADREQA
jgi:ATP-binding cassette subfamily B protein